MTGNGQRAPARALPPLMSPAQAARALRLDLATVLAAMRDGTLPTVERHGRRWVDTLRLLEQMTGPDLHAGDEP